MKKVRGYMALNLDIRDSRLSEDFFYCTQNTCTCRKQGLFKGILSKPLSKRVMQTDQNHLHG